VCSSWTTKNPFAGLPNGSWVTPYEVVLASDGPEALRIVEEQGPLYLFVIDVMMPQMSGSELARQLHQSSGAPEARREAGHEIEHAALPPTTPSKGRG
jgi:CheY-like chemotaxis protein